MGFGNLKKSGISFNKPLTAKEENISDNISNNETNNDIDFEISVLF